MKNRNPFISWLAWHPAMPVVMGGWLAATACPVHGYTFSNTTPIYVSLGGPATPYPSTISIVRATGAVSRVSVSLNDIIHVFPDDLDVLLVGPGGQKVMLMSDAGGSNLVGGVNLTFAQGAGVKLPDSAQIVSGTYEPTDHDPGDILPGAVPPGPYGTDLSVFTGTNPNGEWQLFVFDDATFNGGGGITAGWILELETAEPPTITSQPASQTVAPGSVATFNVGVKGTPPFGYQWLRNGQVLVPFSEGGASLTITNVQAANAGDYVVVVTNIASTQGVTSSNAFLNVLGPLTLVDSPQDQSVAPGASVVMRVTAAGNPPLQYQWRLNGALLAGQTNSTLVLSNVQTSSGGNFSVTVWNGEDVFTTGQARLLMLASAGPGAADAFGDRPTLITGVALEGVLQGDSSSATSEPGEPVFPGGGKSVWYEWIAPFNAIVTLDLRGSGFDTWLGVFMGTTVSNLTMVTQDEDAGGFYTSALQFNAERGMAYQWMIDGFGLAGAGGDYTLNWRLEPTEQKIPVIVQSPQPQAAQAGSNVTFEVVTDSPAEDEYQWLFNGLRIPGATHPTHTVSNALSTDVGFYSVLVTKPNGLVVESPPAPLNRGLGLDRFAADKQEQISLRPTQGAISVGLGETDWNEFPSQANGGVGDPNPCSQPFLKTLFQQVHAEDDGVIQIHTLDSQVFLLLGVYENYVSVLTNNNVLVACDVLNGPSNLPCAVQFNATQGSNYTAVVAPLQAVGTEVIKVTAAMGAAPPIPEAPQCVAVAHGGSQQLQVPANNWAPAPSIQWRFNGQDIPGATNETLMLSNFNATLAGTYSVVLSNFVGMVTNTVAHVAQSGPPVLQAALTAGPGNLGLLVKGSGDQPFALQNAPALAGPWSNVATNPNPCFPLWFTNPNVLLDAQRFYRAVDWTPPGP